MNISTQWGIGLSVGIPALFIFIGLMVLLITFLMKRCRKKAWTDINTVPKHLNATENIINRRKLPKRALSDRQPLYQSETNNAMEVSDSHVSIPIDENNMPPDQCQFQTTPEHQHTLVQIQRDRLNHLKVEESRCRPMIHLNHTEDGIQRTIAQVQKEFDESV